MTDSFATSKKALTTLGLGLVLSQTHVSGSDSAVVPVFPRCGYEANPVGVASEWPALMWEAHASNPEARGVAQTAYRVLAASSTEILARDEGDLWDDGKVASAETLNIVSAGKPLTSLQRVWWKAKLW